MLRIAFIITLATIAAAGCSQVEGPDANEQFGSITLLLEGGSAGPAASALAAAPLMADSARVCVYRAGAGVNPELCAATSLQPPAGSAEIELSVVAEDNKRVAVELYMGGSLLFFGVNEDVDVVPNGNTRVDIIATGFAEPALWRDTVLIVEGQSFSLQWTSTSPGATYLLQESDRADFGNITWQTTLTDTFLTGPLQAGDYHFRVRNIYTPNAWSNAENVHIYGPPSISSISAPEYLRGDVAQITIRGDHLDFPFSNQVSVFGATCAITQASPFELTALVTVPDFTFSDQVSVSTFLGSTVSDDYVRVQTIAYIYEPDVQDSQNAQAFKAAIDGMGDNILNSTAALYAYDQMPSDMTVFDVVVVGSRTGDSSNWFGDPTHIRNSQASVLGIGLGGAALFNDMGLDIGYQDTRTSTQSIMYVLDASIPIYTSPNQIMAGGGPVRDGDLLTMTTTAQILYSLDYNLSFPPPGVAFMSLRSLTNPTRFPFAEQASDLSGNGKITSMLWGFDTVAPTQFSSTGAAVFENSIVYLYAMSLINKGIITP